MRFAVGGRAHPSRMAPAPTSQLPGSMTVSFLADWEHLLTVVVLVILAATAFVVLMAAGAAMSARSEWQAWLDARPGRRPSRSEEVRPRW